MGDAFSVPFILSWFRAFPKCVGPRNLSLESVDYFVASEQYWVVEKKKKKEES